MHLVGCPFFPSLPPSPSLSPSPSPSLPPLPLFSLSSPSPSCLVYLSELARILERRSCPVSRHFFPEFVREFKITFSPQQRKKKRGSSQDGADCGGDCGRTRDGTWAFDCAIRRRSARASFWWARRSGARIPSRSIEKRLQTRRRGGGNERGREAEEESADTVPF